MPRPAVGGWPSPVSLRVYDISNGLAATWSQLVLGRKIGGVWHTGVLVYGLEYFYGGGVGCMLPSEAENSFEMEVVEELLLGYTIKTKMEFERFLVSSRNQFSPDTYDLIDWNCNHFSDICSQFLLDGRGIPEYILDLPEKIASSFIGSLVLKVFKRLHKGANPVGAINSNSGANHPILDYSNRFPIKSQSPALSPDAASVLANNNKSRQYSRANGRDPATVNASLRSAIVSNSHSESKVEKKIFRTANESTLEDQESLLPASQQPQLLLPPEPWLPDKSGRWSVPPCSIDFQLPLSASHLPLKVGVSKPRRTRSREAALVLYQQQRYHQLQAQNDKINTRKFREQQLMRKSKISRFENQQREVEEAAARFQLTSPAATVHEAPQQRLSRNSRELNKIGEPAAASYSINVPNSSINVPNSSISVPNSSISVPNSSASNCLPNPDSATAAYNVRRMIAVSVPQQNRVYHLDVSCLDKSPRRFKRLPPMLRSGSSALLENLEPPPTRRATPEVSSRHNSHVSHKTTSPHESLNNRRFQALDFPSHSSNLQLPISRQQQQPLSALHLRPAAASASSSPSSLCRAALLPPSRSSVAASVHSFAFPSVLRVSNPPLLSRSR